MWIFLWLLLSSFILGVFGWSTWILWEQKKAWAAYAKKNGLQCQRRQFLESHIVRGTVGGFRMSLFSETRHMEDIRRERYVSVIEFELGGGMPTGAAIGTGDMKAFVDTLAFTQILAPDHEKWTGDYIAKTRDREALRLYLTRPRLDALLGLFGMNKASVLFFFDEIDCVLHIETTDPLRDPEKLERIVSRIAKAVRVLALPEMLEARNPDPVPPGAEEAEKVEPAQSP